MWKAFVGTEAIAEGKLTRGQLRWNHIAAHPNVYVPKGLQRTVPVNACAAWLWTGRTGVIAGRAAAALHGAQWVDPSTPIEVIAAHTRPRAGVVVREERIGVSDGWRQAFLDMGYDEPMVGLDYEGAQHMSDRTQYIRDIGRAEMIENQGWIDLRVVAEHSRAYTIHRVREAFARRSYPPKSA